MEIRNKKQAEPSKTKRVAILFSSGLDSTYLMWKNLEEGNEVTPIYIEIKNNENKTKIEKQNVLMLYDMFREKYGYRIKRIQFVTEVSITNHNHDLMFTQLPIWIFSLVYLPMYEIDEIQIGYVLNDDAISYVDDIKKFYKAHAWLMNINQPKLKFPLIKKMKREMMRELPPNYLQYVSSCENPRLLSYFLRLHGTDKRLQYYKPCGDCVACKRIIRDELDYNIIYRQMINENEHKQKLGDELYALKIFKPEKFEEIIMTISQYL